jgi:hypothetical protein
MISKRPGADSFYSITSSARARRTGGMCQSKRLGGLEIDKEFKFRRLLDWNVGGSCAAQDLVRHFP